MLHKKRRILKHNFKRENIASLTRHIISKRNKDKRRQFHGQIPSFPHIHIHFGLIKMAHKCKHFFIRIMVYVSIWYASKSLFWYIIIRFLLLSSSLSLNPASMVLPWADRMPIAICPYRYSWYDPSKKTF